MKKFLRRCVLLICCNFICLSFLAQNKDELRSARKLVEQNRYQEARVKYEAYLKQSPNDADATVEYTDLLFFNLQDYEGAYAFLKKTIIPGKDTTLIQYYGLARCEHYLDNYTSAIHHYEKAISLIKNDRDWADLKRDIEIGLKNVRYAKKNQNKLFRIQFTVVNLGSPVNTAFDEYVPVADEVENLVMFTSRRLNKHNRQPDIIEEKYAEDMYVSRRNGNVFQAPELLQLASPSTAELQNTERNESVISLSPDGKTLFIFKAGTIWKSMLQNDKWTAPVKVEENIIRDEYNNHITITADGKTVYFTRDNDEDKLKEPHLDIFVCRKSEAGVWGLPENIGTVINTAGNEQSPYISPDGKTLYFSSDSREGFGGYDVYYSVYENGKWSDPLNMGRPVNSPADDVFFYPFKDLSKGYLSSNRKGSKGGYDLYRFYDVEHAGFADLVDQAAIAKTITSDDLQAEVRSLLKQPDVKRIFIMVDSNRVIDTSEIFSLLNKDVKSVTVQQVIACDTCLFPQRRNYKIEIAEKIKDSVIVKDSVFPVQEFAASPVFYAVNSSAISTGDDNKLKALAEWLKKNPSRQVKLIGYADWRGSAELNEKLSLRRAKAVAAILKSQGVKDKQITGITGKGESGGEGDSDEEMAKNRRTEVIILPLPLK